MTATTSTTTLEIGFDLDQELATSTLSEFLNPIIQETSLTENLSPNKLYSHEKINSQDVLICAFGIVLICLTLFTLCEHILRKR